MQLFSKIKTEPFFIIDIFIFLSVFFVSNLSFNFSSVQNGEKSIRWIGEYLLPNNMDNFIHSLMIVTCVYIVYCLTLHLSAKYLNLYIVSNDYYKQKREEQMKLNKQYSILKKETTAELRDFFSPLKEKSDSIYRAYGKTDKSLYLFLTSLLEAKYPTDCPFLYKDIKNAMLIILLLSGEESSLPHSDLMKIFKNTKDKQVIHEIIDKIEIL